MGRDLSSIRDLSDQGHDFDGCVDIGRTRRRSRRRAMASGGNMNDVDALAKLLDDDKKIIIHLPQ